MKKWHLEGIINCNNLYGRKVIVPDESQMYCRVVQAYHSKKYKEPMLVSLLRDAVGRVLRHI